MTQVLNLDEFDKVTVKIQGKEYELDIPTLDTLDQFEKQVEKAEKIKTTEEFKAFLRQFFVAPGPSDEVLGKIKTHQYSKFIAVISDLTKGGAKSLEASKKK